MEQTSFFHVCADGADAKNFITCEEDFRTAFNLIGVCAANCDIEVLAFSIEDTHPHFLLYGTYANCFKFKSMYESTYKRSIARTRGSLAGLVLECSIYEITDESYLMNVGTYVIVQATKDGKNVLPYDYLWGTGSMYFRRSNRASLWQFSKDGELLKPVPIKTLPVIKQLDLTHSRLPVPGHWLVCNGLIMPENYVNVPMFEKIYRTHNCFRTFMSSGRQHHDTIIHKLIEIKGVKMEDLEARQVCGDVAKELYGTRMVKLLSVDKRMTLALELRKRYHLSQRQLANVVMLPLEEIEKFLR